MRPDPFTLSRCSAAQGFDRLSPNGVGEFAGSSQK